MSIKISKKIWETDNKIEIWDFDKKDYISLPEKLKDLEFSEKQIDFLDELFHKLFNMKIEIV